jgi:hypothetical protein
LVGHDETLSCGRDKDAGGKGEDDWKTLEKRWQKMGSSLQQDGATDGSPSEVSDATLEAASGSRRINIRAVGVREKKEMINDLTTIALTGIEHCLVYRPLIL